MPIDDTGKEVSAPIEAKVIDEKKDPVEKIVAPESIIDKPKKSSHLSLEKLEMEIETELSKPEIEKVIEKEAKPSGTLELNEENLASSWQHFLESLAKENNKSLLHSINDKNPRLNGELIELIADSQVESSLIEKNILTITRFLKTRLNVSDLKVSIIVEEDETKQRIILNQKEKFHRMQTSNPSLKLLVEKLDLELER